MPTPALSAAKRFRRQIAYLVVAGVVSVPAALAYLASYGPITATMAFAVTFGVFVSIVLGGGLMATGFYSSGSGLDDEVASAGVEPAMATPPLTDLAQVAAPDLNRKSASDPSRPPTSPSPRAC
ncbi:MULTISPECIES: hypothetical protein [Sphingosinicellaceae]|uniref:hypothetical protein n=1 Tax=Sphingosinicellaceae TaxID=2820280 RepID=UPI001C1DF876|nr:MULTISPECIES: hypothetical protein [Polymorphobacter]QYE33404.1 hypothetical protein KZX46_01025 [Polymorphobacter sp. PAMC 29334]UAJ12536.1 hypothetical protein KTC28_22365 [Polymorphobacter megasporae]